MRGKKIQHLSLFSAIPQLDFLFSQVDDGPALGVDHQKIDHPYPYPDALFERGAWWWLIVLLGGRRLAGEQGEQTQNQQHRAAGPVVGLRGRGVTFVGQTESGQIQVIANEDAPLGRQPSLRLYGVGVMEDEPVFHGSCFLDLEIVE